MALQTKINHIDKLPNGVLRVRRRFPKDVVEALGEGFLQVHIRNREGLPFHREYQAIAREFDRIVRETREQLGGKDIRSPIERWHEALMRAEGLVAETIGLEDDETFARHMIAKGLAKRPGTDPLLLKALVTPEAAAPEVSMRDAANLYAKDKGLTEDRDEMIRLDRTLRRLEDAIGPLDQVPVSGLRRDHGRKFLDTLLAARKRDGKPLAIGSAKREAIIVAAIVNHAIKEFDLSSDLSKAFAALPWPKEQTLAVEKKLPLPDALVEAVRVRLEGGRTTELPLIWRLLKGTGMRLNEAVGLTSDDIVLDHDVPHVLVRPNSVRRIKNTSSIRSVPITGDALRAVQEALEGARQGDLSSPAMPALVALTRPLQS